MLVVLHRADPNKKRIKSLGDGSFMINTDAIRMVEPPVPGAVRFKKYTKLFMVDGTQIEIAEKWNDMIAMADEANGKNA